MKDIKLYSYIHLPYYQVMKVSEIPPRSLIKLQVAVYKLDTNCLSL